MEITLSRLRSQIWSESWLDHALILELISLQQQIRFFRLFGKLINQSSQRYWNLRLSDICPIWIKFNDFLNVWYKNASLLLISSQIRHLPRLRCLLLLTQVGEVGVAGALVRSLVVADRNGDIETVTKTLKGMTVAPDSTDRSHLAWPMIVVSLTKISKRWDASHIYSTERENFGCLNFAWLLLKTRKSLYNLDVLKFFKMKKIQ